MRSPHYILAITFGGLILLGTGAALLAIPRTDHLDIPVTSLEQTSQAGIPLRSPLGVTVTPSALHFGSLRPGSTSEVEVRILNQGTSAVRASLHAPSLADSASGVRLPASAFRLTGPEGDVPLGSAPLLPPGSEVTIHIHLDVPSGATQWIPAGDYRGAFGLDLAEVSS